MEGGRPVGYLQSVQELNFGATEDKSIQWQGGEHEPETSSLQVQRPNH